EYSSDCACCVVIASGGYPGAYQTGYPISGLDQKDVIIFHAGTKRDEQGNIVTCGGRVLGVTALAPTLSAAIDLAYKGVDGIKFENAHYRKDIGRT
ncbi:MAG: phosphoribosylamine--glycine ligase, partial [Ruminococcaceae bacterium]|nr:phosphoribosylamine--glycine ligase [Oscillospiraceae bacterium]